MVTSIFQTGVSDSKLIRFSDLSDMHATEFAKCIKTSSGHIKSLGLARNRISDEGMALIVKALCDS